MIAQILTAGVLAAAFSQSTADETTPANVPAAPASVESAPAIGDPVTGTRRLLILCGHPGDDEHRALFVETVDQLREALTTAYGFDADAVTLLFGTDEMLGDGGPAPRGAGAPCTQENIAAIAGELHGTLQSDDVLWVVTMGHTHFDGRHSWFNLAGPDVDEDAFARYFEGLTCRETVFWMTTPASGFYIRPLSADGRIIISATEADREINETIFPHVLADVLSEPVTEAEGDSDRDGRSTLLDLYVRVTRRIARTYLDENALSTEHARLEDNGDGRGSEVQQGFLPEELGGTLGEELTPRARIGAEEGAAAAAIEFGRFVEPAEVESVEAEIIE